MLLHELLRVELAMRQRANEKPSPEEYRDRFPKDHAVIDAVFGPESNRAGRKGSTDSSRATRAGRVAAPSSANPIPPELAGHRRLRNHPQAGRRQHGTGLPRPQSHHGPR